MSHGTERGTARGEPLRRTPDRPAAGAGAGAAAVGEKALMRGLNERLAGFIEKVRHLERQNHLLEGEIREIRAKATPASGLGERYGAELGRLRELARDIARQKHRVEIERQSLEDELSGLRARHGREARGRAEAESNAALLQKDISEAHQAKLQLDQRARALAEEIHFLRKNHEAEVSEMFGQIQEAQATVRAREFGDPGVTAALREIRAQLEGHAASDVLQAAETFRSQFARLTEVAEAKREALKATQREIQEHRKRLQAKSVELDCAKGTREALEKQLHDVEDRHNEEMIHYQNTIKELENELINCKFDMSGYLREYQDLLNVKMALDVEILSYRKLICGEEARLSTMSETHISLPYIYHQSPVYTLPCLSRPGGPHRRAEPQYKFVEEIITETTREIEMSEFEETGSEETEVGKEEQGCAKRESGGSEEERDDKDSRAEEGEQMSDSEQNQVASVVNSVAGGDDGSPAEVDDGETGQKSKEESEETEAGDNEGDNGIDKDAQSKVLLSDGLGEEENEQRQKVAENPKVEEKEAAVTVQKDLSSKPDDLEPDVPAEGELLKKSDDAQKDLSFISAQAKGPVDETPAQRSKESDKTQELSSVVEVQDKIHTLASETAQKATDLREEKKTLETEEFSEKAHVSSSTTTKSEAKENGHAEPKEISTSEPAKGKDEVAKSIQDAKHDSNKVQDKESLKSNVKSLPEVEDQKPDSGDKTQAVLPKEKTTVNAGMKELNQGGPDSSQVQKSKLSEVSEKINDAQDKTEEVESRKSEK